MEYKFRKIPVYRSCLLFTITLTSTAHRPQSSNRLQSTKVLWRSLFMIFHRPITEPLQHFSCDIQNTGCWLIHSEKSEIPVSNQIDQASTSSALLLQREPGVEWTRSSHAGTLARSLTQISVALRPLPHKLS